ncbi:MAG TPA: RNA polymerase sigma factor SigZ [Gammaproteobacteria bacterium]|jgi:RNA polymerase sigma-70 factor (ECF subfamily)|nr:RNA polymerase sigma factor SigZ [Gammaproteobacteria bacterium]
MDSHTDIAPIWHAYQAQLRAFLRSKISDPDEVEDVLQDILVKVFNNLSSLNSDSSIKAWLFQIAHRTVIDFYRARQRKPALNADDLWYNDSDNTVRQQLAECVAPFINALPDDAAQLLTEVELKGTSQKALAEQLGIRYSTLKSRVQSSRQQLRALFEACCEVSFDKNGTVIDFDLKSQGCENC